MEKKLVALCVALFMTACLIFVGCSNTASSSGTPSTMTQVEAIAAIKALQSGGSITIKLGSSVKTISADLKAALKDANKKVTLDLSESGVDISAVVSPLQNALFFECHSLVGVKLPNGAAKIGSLFIKCSSLASVEIPSGVTSIGNFAFNGCSSLTSVEIPSGVTSISYSAFQGCSSLTSVKIPSGVTSISEYAFNSCSSLTSVEIPSSVTSIGGWAFSRCDLLNKIKYTGTKNDWNTRITSFGTNWRSQYPTPVLAGVTCSDGKTYKFAEPNVTSSGTLSDTVL